MAIDRGNNLISFPTILLSIVGILLSIIFGVVANLQPLYIALLVVLIVAVSVTINFFKNFEQTLLGLLILRSALDAFSDQQVPAVFGLGLNILALLYVGNCLIARKKVQTDGFWWFLAGWIALQAVWVVLQKLGGLGLGPSYFPGALREWVRMFSGLMVYLLVMQMKEKVPPIKVVSSLFWSLVAPLTAATLQITVPPSKLPSFLVFQSGYAIEAGSRMNGTLGHPNAFATFTLFFLGLGLWKMGEVKQRIPWMILVTALAFFLVSSKSLTGLTMLVAFIPAFLAPKLNIANIISAVVLFGIVFYLFAGSEMGQERLQSLYGTPLLNPNIDTSRAILLQWTDGNSFNWRVAQWTFLINRWRDAPLLGYGLDTSRFLTPLASYSHNDYIRFLAEEGILGFSLFLIFIFAVFFRLIQLAYSVPSGSAKRNLCFAMLAFFISMLVGMIAGNVWSHTTMFFYWWTLLAVAGWDWDKPVNVEDDASSAAQNQSKFNHPKPKDLTAQKNSFRRQLPRRRLG
ncbi:MULTISPECIES: O-antigen ligase family protein [Calothrix]|uniref:O-antigen ligase family protein n=2 Tax=Calothrix TaxID=1186 RepID=A0ABR8A3Q7_9CYAN|nr:MULTISPECIES: O-antigen ligase family protein [Calothrix]MBD2194398.1 O-antigen ligase family protein [Calothrix parietina FACHB-288]MBD2223180.1 O-antigen ligase family protein [Calothrix anomala FACHB-343]